MLRRLSILVRKPSQTREEFARAWEHHGTLVKGLPGIRAYQQNHVVEGFGVGSAYRIDGIVELAFDSIDAMTNAFASEAARPVKADEPHFLGHGTGYVAATWRPFESAEDGAKLVIVARNHERVPAGDLLEPVVEGADGLRKLIRDDVLSVIGRPEMTEGPQHADLFLHAYFSSVAAAQRAADTIIQSRLDARYSVVRVRTLTVV